MKTFKSIVAATLLSAGMLATAVHANPPVIRRVDQRPVMLERLVDGSSARKFVQVVSLGDQWAVRNTHAWLTIEAKVLFPSMFGEDRTLVVLVGPGQEVPYANMTDGAMGSILSADAVFPVSQDIP